MTDVKHTSSALSFAILTVSDTRRMSEDRSGDILQKLLFEEGHQLTDRAIVRDDRSEIAGMVQKWIDNSDIDIVITTGGTGITGRDVTPEALEPLFEKSIPGFGELFRLLSYQKIGASTIQSRATAGISKGTFIFALPGSPSACQDAWDMILRSQFDRRTKPCNFVSLIPRLTEKG